MEEVIPMDPLSNMNGHNGIANQLGRSAGSCLFVIAMLDLG